MKIFALISLLLSTLIVSNKNIENVIDMIDNKLGESKINTIDETPNEKEELNEIELEILNNFVIKNENSENSNTTKFQDIIYNFNNSSTQRIELNYENLKGKVFEVNNMGEEAEIKGSKTMTIKNKGKDSGRLIMILKDIENLENRCNDQELNDEPKCNNDNIGEFGDVVNLSIKKGKSHAVTSTLSKTQEGEILKKWLRLSPVIIKPKKKVKIDMDWLVDGYSYNNEIQSDSVNFTISFILINTDKNHIINKDSDKDGLSDYEEIKIYDTNAYNKDSDNDGYTDLEEITALAG